MWAPQDGSPAGASIWSVSGKTREGPQFSPVPPARGCSAHSRHDGLPEGCLSDTRISPGLCCFLSLSFPGMHTAQVTLGFQQDTRPPLAVTREVVSRKCLLCSGPFFLYMCSHASVEPDIPKQSQLFKKNVEFGSPLQLSGL